RNPVTVIVVSPSIAIFLSRARRALAVVPTYQESVNVEALLRRVRRVAPASERERRLCGEASPRLQHEDERRNAERVPEAATMIVTPGEPDVTTPCGETPATPGLVE